ncbi:adenosine receptor A2a-like [Limulus polyphemus]|uniref:Adenosine receptor A2a-like n=1 Tax=Limulus polyphemus TaxID=6850 RepID=A0ABM1TMG3_LIMPO|nr:adenosine receptor A2a-like [Limulus polyphemus]
MDVISLALIGNNSFKGIYLSDEGRTENDTVNDCFHTTYNVNTPVIVFIDLSLAVVAVLGNSLVLVVVYRFRWLRTITNMFVVSLAAADLLVGINVPFYVLFYFDLPLVCNKYSCLFRYWFAIYASGCSMLCLVGVAVDRYVAILHPLSYHRIMKSRCVSAYIAVVWVYMGIISSLPLLGIGETFDSTKECDLYYLHSSTYALTVVAFHVLLTLIITTVLHCIIFREAWKQSRAMAAIEVNSRVRQDARTTITMAMVLGACLLGFLPYLIIISLPYMDDTCQEVLGFLKRYFVCLYFGKSAVNPIIYGWKNRDFRDAFKKLLCSKKSAVSLPR